MDLLRAAPAVGALTMAIVLARWPLGSGAGVKMFVGVAIYGVATMAFALSTSFPVAMLSLVVLGAADMVSVVVRQTIVPLHTPDEMRGRVNAVSSLFVGTSNQLGDFRAGAMAAVFGAVASVLIGGIGTLLIVALWMRLFPQLLRVDRLDAVQRGERQAVSLTPQCGRRLRRAQPMVEEIREPGLHSVIVNPAILEMRDALLRAGQIHAMRAADRPFAHHGVRDFGMKLDADRHARHAGTPDTETCRLVRDRRNWAAGSKPSRCH